MKHKIRLNGKYMTDKQTSMEHLSDRFGLVAKVTNLDALWDVLSSLKRIEKITLIHAEDLVVHDYGQKIMKLLIEYAHLKGIICTIR